MSVKDLAAALVSGGDVHLEGNYILNSLLRVTKSINITGIANITMGFKSTVFPIIFSGPIFSLNGSINFDMKLNTPGVKIASPVVDSSGLNVKNVLQALRMNAVEISGAITHLNFANSIFDKVWGSGLFVTNSNHIRINNISGNNVCQKYPAGGVVCIDDSCTDVIVDTITGSGITQNDIVYVGTSRKLIPGVIVRNIKGILTNNPAAGAGYQACGVKMYGQNGLMENVDVTWQTNWGYGISDWGKDDIIRNIKIRGGSHGVGLFGSSTIPLTGMDIQSAINYDNNGNYTIAESLPKASLTSHTIPPEAYVSEDTPWSSIIKNIGSSYGEMFLKILNKSGNPTPIIVKTSDGVPTSVPVNALIRLSASVDPNLNITIGGILNFSAVGKYILKLVVGHKDSSGNDIEDQSLEV